MAVGMYLAIVGLSGITAVTAAVLTAVGTPLTIACCMLVFPDERCPKPGRFTLGMLVLLAATGWYALAATGEGGSGVDEMWGIGLFGSAVVLRVFLGLLLKDVLRRRNSQAVSTMNATVCAAVLAIGALLSGGPMPVQVAGWGNAALLLLSGVLGIWAGVALQNWLIWGAGLVRVKLSTAAIPPTVAVAGWLVLGESLGLAQLLAGSLMMGCVVYLMRLKHESAPALPEPSEPVVLDQATAAIRPVVADPAETELTSSHR